METRNPTMLIETSLADEDTGLRAARQWRIVPRGTLCRCRCAAKNDELRGRKRTNPSGRSEPNRLMGLKTLCHPRSHFKGREQEERAVRSEKRPRHIEEGLVQPDGTNRDKLGRSMKRRAADELFEPDPVNNRARQAERSDRLPQERGLSSLRFDQRQPG